MRGRRDMYVVPRRVSIRPTYGNVLWNSSDGFSVFSVLDTFYSISLTLSFRFTNRSEKDHAAYQRIIGTIYSLTSVLRSEPELDKTVSLFIQRLTEFADSAEPFDFGFWLEMYTYDNIGVVFFGKQFGFLEHSIDHKGYIRSVHKAMPLLHALAAAPAYVRPIIMSMALVVPNLLKAVIAVSDIKTTAERETREAQARAEADTMKRVDMTSLMLGIMREKGEKNNFGMLEIVSENWVAV